MVKRLHDRNKPGYLAAIVLGVMYPTLLPVALGITGDPQSPDAFVIVSGLTILVVSIWMAIELGLRRGTPGPNQYGADPLGQS